MNQDQKDDIVCHTHLKPNICKIFFVCSILAAAPSNLRAQTKSVAQGSNVTVLSQTGVVAADHPLASAIGAKVLKQGGTAADAGVATLLALGVVNPFASGLGGGGFCVHRKASDGSVSAIDFRETAPKAARRDMYIVGGKVNATLSREGGLAVGVPGEAAGLWALHKKFGALSWKKVVQPAWQIAQHGFVVGTLLPLRLERKGEKLKRRPHLAKAFRDAKTGGWIQTGKVLKRHDLALALALFRDQGAKPFYKGAIAKAIVAAANAQGGKLTVKDLATYKVSMRRPVQGTYRGYDIISMPPPSSGGVALIQTLNILEGFDLSKLGYTPKALHLIAEALKHAFADRARHLGDADFVKVPMKKLTSKAYATSLRKKIDVTQTKSADFYGFTKPPKDDSGTTHISVIDAKGNMLACTSTVNTSFGSMVYVPKFGLTLNNQMDDFSAQPGTPNAYGLVGNTQNAIAARKRPLSSMTPTLILKNKKPFMIAGASGGPTIITGTLQAILRIIDFAMTPAQAVTKPRLHHQWLPHRIYAETGGVHWDKLATYGHKLKRGKAWNSVQIVVRTLKGWVGVSDPRKFGRPAAP